MSIIGKHNALVAEKVSLQQRIIREEATLESVVVRMNEVGVSSAEWGKARDKRRHIDERLATARLELVEIEGELEKLRFEGQFD